MSLMKVVVAAKCQDTCGFICVTIVHVMNAERLCVKED